MNVLLHSSEVALFLASHTDGEETFAWILKLEPYSGPPPPPMPRNSKAGGKKSKRVNSKTSRSSLSENESSSSSSSSSNSSSSLPSCYHPFAKLPWFKRRPTSEIKKIRASKILMRLRVVPAFFIHEDGAVDNDGYLLSHGLYNFDLRGENEETECTPVV